MNRALKFRGIAVFLATAALWSSSGAYAATCTGGQAVYYIRQGATKGSGSTDRPFGSVQDAITAASAAAACNVWLFLGPSVNNVAGVYDANFNQSFNLNVRAWYLNGVASPGLPKLRGSISNLAGYALNLTGVIINGGNGFGYAVYQSGGSLRIQDSYIQNATKSAYGDKFHSGFGIRIDGGAQAILIGDNISSNADAGLIVSGTGTYLQAKNLIITDNTGVGLFVTQGAKAHIRSLTVLRTKAVTPTTGGHNIQVNGNSVLELHNAQSYEAALAGISIWSAYVTVTDSSFYSNEWGVVLGPRPAPLPGATNYLPQQCMKPNVRAFSNRSSDLEDQNAPAPSSDCVINPNLPQCTTTCATVPYSLQ